MLEGFGFKAYISTEDGEILPEYGLETDSEKNEMRCWIPSQAGQKFNVSWENIEHHTKDTAGYIILDGVNVGGLALRKSKSPNDFVCVKDSVFTSPTTKRYFMFSSLQLTDDESISSAASARNMGEISLEIRQVERLQSTFLTGKKLREQNAVHETSSKGLVHSVGFSEEETTPKQTSRRVSYVQTLAKFVFKYSPLDVLRANGIAPRDTPSRIPTSAQPDISVQPSVERKTDVLKEEDSVDDNNDSQSKETKDIVKTLIDGGKRKVDATNLEFESQESDDEAREVARLRARIRKLEREQELEDLRERLREIEGKRTKAKRVKTEPEARPAFIPGEVIDLT